MKKCFNYFKLKHTEKVCFKNIIIYSIVILIAIFSLFFSNFFENLFNLKISNEVKSNNETEVHFVDVGQGDCVLIRFNNNKTMIVDSGPKSSNEKLMKYIKEVFFKNNEKKFDYAVLTHTDSDHYGNFKSIIEKYKIDNFFVPNNFYENLEIKFLLEEVEKRRIKTNKNFEGVKICLDSKNVVKWLSPLSDFIENDNDYSPMMLFELNNKKMLLTGDMGLELENILVANSDLSNIDILKAGHHGSKYSTGENLILEAKPKFIVVSAGENSYGHPSVELMQRIYDYNKVNSESISMLSTIDSGNIVFNISESKLKVSYIDDINDYFILKWWVVVLIFNFGIILYFVVNRKYAINKIFEKGLKKTTRD